MHVYTEFFHYLFDSGSPWIQWTLQQQEKKQNKDSHENKYSKIITLTTLEGFGLISVLYNVTQAHLF